LSKLAKRSELVSQARLQEQNRPSAILRGVSNRLGAHKSKEEALEKAATKQLEG